MFYPKRDQPQQVQGIRLIRIQSKQLPANGLGLLELPRFCTAATRSGMACSGVT